MDILEVVYFMSRTGLSNEDYNRLNEIINKSNRSDLFKMSPKGPREEIFKYLEDTYINKEN